MKPLNCPFCGSNAEIFTIGSEFDKFDIRCKNIECHMADGADYHFKTEEEAIASWNNRKMANNFQAAFINTLNEPQKETHICYFTKESNTIFDIDCFEVYEALFPHPDAPDCASIPITLIRKIDTQKRNGRDGGHLVLLEAANKNSKLIYQTLKLKEETENVK